VAGAETPAPVASVTDPATQEIPTEPSSSTAEISILQPVANREFGPDDTINFDWFWPTVPEPGEHFAVYLIDGDQEYQLGALRGEPKTGQVYRLEIPVSDLPVAGGELAWQVRLELIRGGGIRVASDRIPIVILTPTPTATVTGTPPPTDTASPTAEACVPDPPFGWVQYSVRPGESASAIAERGNITVEFLLQVNCLADDLLSIGQRIWVPPGSVPRTPTPTQPPPTPIPQPSPTIQGVTPAPPPPPPPPPNTPVPSATATNPPDPTDDPTPTEEPEVTSTNPPPELTLTP
jgi:LysM repeat protein